MPYNPVVMMNTLVKYQEHFGYLIDDVSELAFKIACEIWIRYRVI